MRQPWLPLSKMFLGDLFGREKSPKVYVLDAESFRRRHDRANFPKESLCLGILSIPEPQRPDTTVLGSLIPDCSQRVAQAFQPVQAQAKACGYRK